MSALGVGMPLLLSNRLHSRVFSLFFFVTRVSRDTRCRHRRLILAQHFGTGVIVSVAFVHLLFHAFVMFNNDCIGELAFEPAAPTIAMAAALVTLYARLNVMPDLQLKLAVAS